MTTKLRFTALVVTMLSAMATAHSATASGDPPKGEPVPFETVEIVSGTSGINLYDRQILRLASSEDIDAAGALLTHGNDSTLADEVINSIGEIPAGKVVLVGIIDISCTPAETAGLVRLDDGHLAMFAPGHVPEPIECFVANTTVAVLEVDAADAPPGSGDGAELVHFGFAGLDNPGTVMAVELTEDADALTTILPDDGEVPVLPTAAAGMRRLAFVGAGCAYASAELWVTSTELVPHFEQEDPDVVIMCDAAGYYLAVFAIPGDQSHRTPSSPAVS
jgi:hypothetical protein